MALYRNAVPLKSKPQPVGITEFEILKATHRFLRDEDNPPAASERPGEQDAAKTLNNSSSSKSWNEQLAEKYYSSLYREFAVCDLKHYKTGNFALRWRSEDEVLSGAGETTCGNTRCEHHEPSTAASWSPRQKPNLVTLELPFAYLEMGETKSALVKVVLCPKCVKKLMWKHIKEKEKREGKSNGECEDETSAGGDIREAQRDKKGKRKREDSDSDGNGKDREEREHRKNKDGRKSVAFSTDTSGDQGRKDRTPERSQRHARSHSSSKDRSRSQERDRRRHHSSEKHSTRHHSRREPSDEKRPT